MSRKTYSDHNGKRWTVECDDQDPGVELGPSRGLFEDVDKRARYLEQSGYRLPNPYFEYFAPQADS